LAPLDVLVIVIAGPGRNVAGGRLLNVRSRRQVMHCNVWVMRSNPIGGLCLERPRACQRLLLWRHASLEHSIRPERRIRGGFCEVLHQR